MNVYEIVISYIVVVICGLGIFETYRKISEEKLKLYTIKNIIIIMIASLVEMVIALEYYGVYKGMMILLVIYIVSLIIFKENYKETFAKICAVQMIEVIIEVSLSIILVVISVDIKTYDNSFIIKNLVSVLIALLELLIVYIKEIRKNIKKVIEIVVCKKVIIIKVILIIFYLFITYLSFTSMINVSGEKYITNSIFLVMVLSCIGYIIYNNIKIIQAEEKQKVLLEFMRKYEYLIDKDSVNRHEMLNNLIILNSFEDRNSEAFEKELREMIEKYDTKKQSVLKNIGHLPTGIKGILYYKINDIEINGIKLVFQCTEKVSRYLKDTENKEYTKCCKLVGIFLDNAIEGAKRSKEKEIVIDIYLEKEYLHIYIENTVKGKIEIEEINKKNYSTKGKNRGLGLYIASGIKKRSKNIDYKQSINGNRFITDLYFKVK